MTMSLNDQQLAVLSAGGTLSPEEIAAATALAISQAEQATNQTTEPIEDPAATIETAQVTEAQTAAAETTEATGNALVTFLQTELKAANAALLEATVSLRDLQAKSAEALEHKDALTAIAAGAVNKMNIALGSSERDLSAFSVASLLAEHSAVSVDFNKKFKVGGVAVAAPDESAVVAKAVATPLHQAKINAVKEGK